MLLFWPDIVPFKPGYISSLSRCWESVLHLGVTEHVKANQEFSFLSEKRYIGKFAYVKKGCLYSFIPLPDGSERLKLVVDEGCLIYDSYCAAGGCERLVWHRAKTNVEMVCFDGRLLHLPEFQKQYPFLIANVLRSTATKYIMFDALLECMQKKTALEKVAWYLDKLSDMDSRAMEISPGLSQSEVATLLGISRASMTRVVTALKEKGIVSRFTRRSLRILDKERLKAFAQND